MKEKAPLVKKIISYVETVVTDMGFELVDIIMQGTGRPLLQILVDNKTNNITLDECSKISQAIATVMDVENVMGETAYILEVGSPGIDRPLTKEDDFERFAGKKIKVYLDTDIEGKKRHIGLLKGMKGKNVLLEIDNTDINIPYINIDRAKIHTDDDLLQRQEKKKK